MKMQKGQIINLEIKKLAFGGQGLGVLENVISQKQEDETYVARTSSRAEDNGFRVFADGVVPGDKIEARIKKIKKNYAEADVVSIIEPSPLRIAPKCKHFGKCGGCKWQMLAYEEQLKFKESQVREAMSHVGGLKNVETLVKPIIGCSEPWFYRNKMEFSFGNESKEDTELRLGLHPAGRHVDIFDVEECFLQSEKSSEILARVRDFARKNNLSFYNSATNEGLLSSLYIRDGKNTGEIMVNLVTCEEFMLGKEFCELFEDMPEIVSIYWTKIARKRGMKTQVGEVLLKGKPSIREELGMRHEAEGRSLKFKISPQAFFQPNTHQAEILYSQAVKAAGLTGSEVVFDLYCGTGTIGLFCAHKAKKIYGLELNESAIANAKQNAMLNGIENSWFKAGDVDKSIREIPDTPDVVIVDPPRAGLGESVVLKIVDFQPKTVVYVSCDPVNLARDLKTFVENGYKVESIQPVDMFPHTYHIENVARIVKGKFGK